MTGIFGKQVLQIQFNSIEMKDTLGNWMSDAQIFRFVGPREMQRLCQRHAAVCNQVTIEDKRKKRIEKYEVNVNRWKLKTNFSLAFLNNLPWSYDSTLLCHNVKATRTYTLIFNAAVMSYI